MTYKKIILLLLVAFLPLKSFGAITYFSSEKKEFDLEEDFKIDFLINTEDRRLNSIKGSIEIPSSLEAKYIDDGGSVVNLWIEKPSINGNKITFAGLSPGGFNSSKSFIFSIVVRSNLSGIKNIKISEMELFRDDGLGTKVPIKEEDFFVNISSNVFSQRKYLEYDKVPPEDFVPIIERDRNIFNNQWFVVFNAQDKGVGIDHYEVREGWFGEYKEAISPYLLEKQDGERVVFVKAVDRAGNQNSVLVKSGISTSNKVVIVLVLFFIIVLFIWFLKRRRFLKNKST